MIESKFKKFFNDLLVNISNFFNRNFCVCISSIDEPGLHFGNSNLDEYDVDRDKYADKKDSRNDKMRLLC